MNWVVTSMSGEQNVPVIGDAASLLEDAMVLPHWDSLIVHRLDEDFPRLMFDWHPGYGFVLHCFEDGDSWGFFLAESLEWGPCEVRVELGGQSTEDWPKQLFVPWRLALGALEAFLTTGRQLPTASWVRTDQIPRNILKETP